ncbi:MAG: diacylglycerol kinase [Alphaproteobacteria bacterium]|nr:diacylglycerol kinase [Alphaproteobacteria bacterium]
MSDDQIEQPLERIVSALKRAGGGIAEAWKMKILFRVELIAALILVPYVLTLHRPPAFKAVLIGVLFPVLVAELFSVAIGRITGVDRHPALEAARKAASAAVLLTAINAFVVWKLALNFF